MLGGAGESVLLVSWTETVGDCPEAIGPHQLDANGKCCFCGAKVGRSSPRYDRHQSAQSTRYSTQDPRWIDGPDEADYLDGR